MACYNTGYTGQNFCDKGSRFGKPTALILAKDTHTESASNFLLEATWNTAINALNVFPIKNMKNFEDNSTEAQYYDYPDGGRKFIEQGNYRFSSWFDLNECSKKQLINFRGFTGGIYLVYGDIIRGRTIDSGVTILPIRVDQLNVEKETLPGMDGTPAMVKLVIDLVDEKDLNEYAHSRKMAWDVYDLDGLTEVTLAQVGTASATSITVSVNSTCGGNSKPINGIGLDTSSWGVSGAGTLSSVAAGTSAGQYVLTTVGATDSTVVTLKSPADRTDDVFVIADGTLSIDVT